MNKQTKTKANPRAMEIYQPNQIARRGNTDLAKRGNYSIVPADDYDLDVIDGKVNLYRPDVVKQSKPKKERKPFNLRQTIKEVFLWVLVTVVISTLLVFSTLTHDTQGITYALNWFFVRVWGASSGLMILMMIYLGHIIEEKENN